MTQPFDNPDRDLRQIRELRAEIQKLVVQRQRDKDLLTRAYKALECFVDYPLPFVEELRKAAE